MDSVLIVDVLLDEHPPQGLQRVKLRQVPVAEAVAPEYQRELLEPREVLEHIHGAVGGVVDGEVLEGGEVPQGREVAVGGGDAPHG